MYMADGAKVRCYLPKRRLKLLKATVLKEAVVRRVVTSPPRLLGSEQRNRKWRLVVLDWGSVLRQAIFRCVVTLHRLILGMKNGRSQKIAKQQLSAINYSIIADSWNHNLKVFSKIVDN